MPAKMTSMRTEDHDSMLALEVSFWRVVPAWIAMNDGGATPEEESNQLVMPSPTSLE